MPYRSFTLPSGDVVRTRVSDEATLEWFELWVSSEGQATQDRPPDIDTDAHRMWIQPRDTKHAEEWLEAFGAPDIRSINPLVTFTQTIPSVKRAVKVLVTEVEKAGGEWFISIRVKGQRFDGHVFLEVENLTSVDELEKSDALLQESLEGLGMIGEGFDPDWIVGYGSDLPSPESPEADELDKELKAEVAANGPLPELKWEPRFRRLKAN
jgi:hypothetical protein